MYTFLCIYNLSLNVYCVFIFLWAMWSHIVYKYAIRFIWYNAKISGYWISNFQRLLYFQSRFGKTFFLDFTEKLQLLIRKFLFRPLIIRTFQDSRAVLDCKTKYRSLKTVYFIWNSRNDGYSGTYSHSFF